MIGPMNQQGELFDQLMKRQGPTGGAGSGPMGSVGAPMGGGTMGQMGRGFMAPGSIKGPFQQIPNYTPPPLPFNGQPTPLNDSVGRPSAPAAAQPPVPPEWWNQLGFNDEADARKLPDGYTPPRVVY